MERFLLNAKKEKMMEKKSLILIGGGGHCTACIDVIEAQNKYKIVGIVDRKELVGTTLNGYAFIGTDEDLEFLIKKHKNVLITVGQIKSSEARERLFNLAQEFNADFPVIISPHAVVSKNAKIGSGTIVMHGVIIQASSSIGKNGIINDGALIEHGARVGEHCHVSTRAVINGESIIGDKCFIGSGAVVIQGVEIDKGAIIGAGVIIKRNVQGKEIVK